MSGSVYSNPFPVFPCSVCAGNVTWRGRSVQCCTCSNWIHLKCSLLSFSRFRTLGRSHYWSCPPCCVSAFFGDPTSTRTVTSSSNFFSWYTSPAQSGLSGPLLLMQHSHSTLVFKPLILFPQTSYLLPLHPHHRLMLLAVSLTSCFFFPSLIPSGFFNGMLAISKPGSLNCYTLFRLIPLILFVSRNLTLIYLPLSGSLDSLLCDLIAATPILIFFPLISHTLAAVLSFSSGRAYPSLSFLPLYISSLDPYTDYAEVNISLNNSSSLSFLNAYAPPICSSPKDSRTNFFPPSILPSSRNLFILEDFNCHHPL